MEHQGAAKASGRPKKRGRCGIGTEQQRGTEAAALSRRTSRQSGLRSKTPRGQRAAWFSEAERATQAGRQPGRWAVPRSVSPVAARRNGVAPSCAGRGCLAPGRVVSVAPPDSAPPPGTARAPCRLLTGINLAAARRQRQSDQSQTHRAHGGAPAAKRRSGGGGSNSLKRRLGPDKARCGLAPGRRRERARVQRFQHSRVPIVLSLLGSAPAEARGKPVPIAAPGPQHAHPCASVRAHTPIRTSHTHTQAARFPP